MSCSSFFKDIFCPLFHLIRLEKNYVRAPSICLLRKNVYEHYTKFCQQESLLPGTNAILGKVSLRNFYQNFLKDKWILKLNIV